MGIYRKRTVYAGLVLMLCAVLLLQGCAEAIVVGGMGGLVAMNDTRSARDSRQDVVLEKAARRALDRDRALRHEADINVTSFNGTLLLTGQVSSREQKKHVSALIQKTAGTHRVRNEILVSSAPMDNTWISDSYTAARVKARLVFSDVDAARIKVVSDFGNVYLMGQISHAESDQVIAMASDVNGVLTVTGVFDYVD